jgi:hypothetical protein
MSRQAVKGREEAHSMDPKATTAMRSMELAR